jgi:hypothetical protein
VPHADGAPTFALHKYPILRSTCAAMCRIRN